MKRLRAWLKALFRVVTIRSIDLSTGDKYLFILRGHCTMLDREAFADAVRLLLDGPHQITVVRMPEKEFGISIIRIKGIK